jgi:hypothetical protein
VNEISTRIWLDEPLWNAVTDRAITEGVTVRELIPQLVRQCLTASPAAVVAERREAGPPASAAAVSLLESADAETGLPIMPLADVYLCSVCGAEVRLGGVSQHMNKHKKERESSEAERS